MIARFTLLATTAFLLAAGSPAGSQTQPLAAGEVNCNAEQLADLAARTFVARAGGDPESKSIGIAYTFASRFGDISGLAYTQQFFREGERAETPEHHLWFSTNPHEVRMLRNPARPALPALSLTRNALNSDLVAPGHPDRFDILINPTLGGSPNPQELLHLDNVDSPAGRSTSAKPGRGLSTAVTSCHSRFTDADVHVFSLLAKTLRAFPFDARGRSRDSAMTIYRDEASRAFTGGGSASYRIDVFPLDAGVSQRSSFLFEVEISSAGRLGAARLSALPVCSGSQAIDCTAPGASAMLLFSDPVLSGEFWSMTPHTPSACTDDLLGLPGCDARVDFTLAEVLDGTSWLQVR